MARELSEIQKLLDNTHAGKTGASYGDKRPISVNDLRVWMNNNFFRGNSTSKTDDTPSTGNAGVPTTQISLNNSFSNRSWISVHAKGTSEKDHNYYKGTKARLRVKCQAAIPGKWKLVVGGIEDTTDSNGTYMDTGNTLNVRDDTSSYSPGTTTGERDFSAEIHYLFDGGSTYSKLTGFKATMGFGSTNSSWKNDADSAKNIGGSGGTEGSGAWDHLTYN